jgi:MFS transporter, DHA1 family, inner membrane transport protein
MQQVRLVAAAPPLAPASVSLNTSMLYVGKAIGSATAGLLFGRELLHSMGFVAAGFVVLAVAMVPQTRPTATVPDGGALSGERSENRRNDIV